MQIDFWHKVYCDWFVGINLAGENMFFQCPSDAFMAGVRSVFDCDVTEDRVYVDRYIDLRIVHTQTASRPSLLKSVL